MSARELTIPELVSALIPVLDQQVSGLRGLQACLQHRREAIRSANAETLVRLVDEEHHLTRALAQIDAQRSHVVAALTRAVAPGRTNPLRLTELLDRLDAEQSTRLTERAETLRQLTREIRHDGQVLRQATEALSRHMAGIMQSVQGVLSQAGVYQKQGRLQAQPALESNIDVRR